MAGLCPLFFFCLLYSAAHVATRGSRGHTNEWPYTLNHKKPKVVANGGFCGIFPSTSSIAYEFAIQSGLSNLLVSCPLHISKDGVGFCFPNLLLDNSSDVKTLTLSQSERTYIVDGVNLTGFFAVQFNFKELENLRLTQGVYSRYSNLDSVYPFMPVKNVTELNAAGFWLDIQNVLFYQEFNLSMRSQVISISKNVLIDYISSTDMSFLLNISSLFRKTRTKLILQYSSKQSYGSIVGSFKKVKSFVNGILVPKAFIWPEDAVGYLQNHTSLVFDAHMEGLEVFASDFFNDGLLAFDYSYDSTKEYLQFIDNDVFSVDGLFSDFPITASAAIDCFSHNKGPNYSGPAKFQIISNGGASGDYPAFTNLAYRKAVEDGVDILDCTAQVTKDNQVFCLRTLDLVGSSNAAEIFLSRKITVQEINLNNGICTCDLTWNEIRKDLTPQLWNPYAQYDLFRNPRNAKSGKFLKLSQFLNLAQKSNVSGVIIRVENAAYLLEQRRLDLIGGVLDALGESGYGNDSTKRVMIESTNSSVLRKFKGHGKFELVYSIEEDIRNVTNSAIEDIRQFSDSVVITRKSVYPTDQGFIIGATNVVQRLKSYNLSVIVSLFRNEFVSVAWDFMLDAMQEMNTFVLDARIDGLVTDFPSTAAAYRKNRCLKFENLPNYMAPVQVTGTGALLQLMTPDEFPPSEAPYPVLSDADVAEAPLPFLAPAPVPTSNNSSHSPSPSLNGSTSSSPRFAPYFPLLLPVLLFPPTFFLLR